MPSMTVNTTSDAVFQVQQLCRALLNIRTAKANVVNDLERLARDIRSDLSLASGTYSALIHMLESSSARMR